MKTHVAILFFLFLAFSGLTQVQHGHDHKGHKLCGADAILREAMKDPEARKEMESLEKFTEYYIENKLYEQDKNVKVIPVVFHVIHNYGQENISNAQILDALRIINEDYALLNTDAGSVVPAFQGIVGNPQVEFRLARKDPNNQCTDGITRTVSTLTYSAGDNVKDLINWNSSKYLNIWVVDNIESGAGGYSYLPGTPINPIYRGIVVVHKQLGSIGTSNGSNYASRTLTHEIGHYFNLLHPWGWTNEPGVAANCNDDDGVTDTPNTIGTLLTCNLTQNSCSSLDNVQNYMDYATCAIMFTQGQVQRMMAALNSTAGGLSYLWQQSNLIATGTNDGYAGGVCAPKADFTSNTRQTCAGGSVSYTDLSYNADEDGSWSWSWSFPGGTPSTSQLKNPTITYNTAGTFNAVLTVSNSTGSTTKTKTQYVKIYALGGGEGMPLFEGFENSSFPVHQTSSNKDWVIAGTSTLKWERTNATYATGSACLRLRNLSIPKGHTNTFTTPNIDMSFINLPIDISFKVAYARKNGESVDKLRVLISSNCGLTWQPRYARIGTSLATNGGAFVTSTFVPNASQWRQETVSISALANKPNTLIQFEFTSEGGNNIYIDDINITGTVGIEAQSSTLNDLQIYPNPVTYESYVSFLLSDKKNIQFSVYDIIGKNVFTIDMGVLEPGGHDFNLRDITGSLNSGIYIFEVNAEGNKTTRKIVVLD